MYYAQGSSLVWTIAQLIRNLPRSYFSRRATKLDTMRARWAEFRTPKYLISDSHKYISSSTPKKCEKLSVFRKRNPNIHQIIHNSQFLISNIIQTYVYIAVDPIVLAIHQYPCDIVAAALAQQTLFYSGSKPKVENSKPCLNDK